MFQRFGSGGPLIRKGFLAAYLTFLEKSKLMKGG